MLQASFDLYLTVFRTLVRVFQFVDGPSRLHFFTRFDLVSASLHCSPPHSVLCSYCPNDAKGDPRWSTVFSRLSCPSTLCTQVLSRLAPSRWALEPSPTLASAQWQMHLIIYEKLEAAPTYPLTLVIYDLRVPASLKDTRWRPRAPCWPHLERANLLLRVCIEF